MTKQERILENLSFNHCIISDAIAEVCTRQEFDKLRESDKDFQAAIKDLDKKRDDFVRVAQMDLIASGDSKLTLEYLKELSKSDGDALGTIQRESMIYIIETANNNSAAIETFQKIFSCTKYKANQVFTDTLSQNDLESPTVKNKNREENIEQSLFKRFSRGELDKIEMYRELMKNALYMSEFAPRDDVKIAAGKLIKEYDLHLVEEEARVRLEGEIDKTNKWDGMDSIISGVSPDEILKFKDRLMNGPPAIEEVD